MKNNDALILAGAAILGFWLLSQQKPAEAKEGGISLGLDMPDITLPQFNLPDINIPETKVLDIKFPDVISETIGVGGIGGGLDLSGLQKQIDDFLNQVKETVTGGGEPSSNGKGIVDLVPDTGLDFLNLDIREQVAQEWGLKTRNPFVRMIRDAINLPYDILSGEVKPIPGISDWYAREQNLFAPTRFMDPDVVIPEWITEDKYRPSTYSQFLANREASRGIPEIPSISEIELERETALWAGYKESGY